MLLISTILLSSLSSVSYAYQINRIPTSLTNKHNRVATTAIYQRPPSYEPPPYDDNDYYYDDDEYDDRDPFDYFDDYEDVDLPPPPLGYNQNYEPSQPNNYNNNYRPQQDDGNFEFDMTPSNQNRVPNNGGGSGTYSIKEQQAAYRNTKYNRSTSWQSRQNYRLDQTPYGTPNNVYPPSSNNLSNTNSNSNSNRQDFQRTSGSPSTWSQQLYDSQNNFNPLTSSLLPTQQQQQQLQSSRYGKLPGQSPLLNTRSSYERGGELVPNGTPSGGFNRDGILSPSNNNLYPSNNNNPNNPYSLNSPQRQQQQQRRGGLASIITGAQTIGESYTDNFRRGPGSEDFRQSTRQKRSNTVFAGGRERSRRDVSEYGTSNSIGQWNDDQRYENFDSWDTVDGRMGRDPRDDYGFDREPFEEPFDREEWDDNEFDDINERRETWDSIADTRRQEVGVGREGNSYYYEPQPGDYTYDGRKRSNERSRRETEDLLGRGNDDLRRDREEEYEYDSGDFAWQRRRRRREQEEPPQQDNNREVAFNRSRPTSIGNIANTIPRRPNPTIDVTAPFNNNNSRRPDSIGKKAWSDSSPSPSSKKQSPTFTYQNEENDYRRRGEQQSPQYGREIAFGRNEATTPQFGGNSYSQDRRRSSLETKSSTFGQMRSPPPRPTERINPQQQQQNQQQQRNRVEQPPPPPRQQQYDQGGMNRPIEQPPNTSRWSNQSVQRPVEPQQSRRPQRNTKQLKSTQKPQKYSNQGPLRNEFKMKEKNPFDFVDDIIKNGVNILDQIRDVRGDTTTSSSKKNKNSRMNKKRKPKSSSSSLEEDRITKVLLADARSYIISDTSLRNILGESISIGEVYTRSYSSTMVNGTNRSRCQISFEVNGSRGSGKGTLIANQEDIIKLDVDIGNDVIEVNVRRQQGFNVRDLGR